MDLLDGGSVVLRRATPGDAPDFRAALERDEVARWWTRNGWLDVEGDLARLDHRHLAIVADGAMVGMIQWWEEDSPVCPYATIDMFLHPDYHRHGYGSDALRTLVDWLLGPAGHHRVTIDPATDNTAAISCYEKVGFRRVGVLRQYGKDDAGQWRDALLLDLLADDLAGDREGGHGDC
ncbi:aminoglycoside 6'-N-acetyltransferase [Kitasatospora sp. GAS204A]|uniref:GNAT family N-acetyltransferase n=1 Tax=unclassified Kitasatospora TaxID=2633591 RepID=UPI0024735834|nr:GNAT family protein [Kitasatospora sp. GAS204B]MDH6122878.1 aminoglycoside 6'-N-acetyltransferase [Kitasatospora sp. GAS204B]